MDSFHVGQKTKAKLFPLEVSSTVHPEGCWACYTQSSLPAYKAANTVVHRPDHFAKLLCSHSSQSKSL